MRIGTLGSLVMGHLIVASMCCQPDTQGAAHVEQGQGGEDGEVHWSYEGDTGTEMWGQLDPAFAACDTGVQQSPIDLTGAIPVRGNRLKIQWQPTEAHVVNNGHAIQVNMAEGSSITLEDRRFFLLQFHFHLPSEHTVEGTSSPMEVHFVHQAEEGDLAVIGIFMDVGEAHAITQSIWDAVPGGGTSSSPLTRLDPNAFLPEASSFFRYAGSLTTPPCSEVVSWVVMTESISVSRSQADAFAAMYPMNARPAEPLHRRFILLRQ